MSQHRGAKGGSKHLQEALEGSFLFNPFYFPEKKPSWIERKAKEEGRTAL